MILDHRQELGGRQQAALGVLPAYKCLDANDRAGPHVDLGLVMQHELSLRQRDADAFETLVPCRDGCIVIDVEQMEAILA